MGDPIDLGATSCQAATEMSRGLGEIEELVAKLRSDAYTLQVRASHHRQALTFTCTPMPDIDEAHDRLLEVVEAWRSQCQRWLLMARPQGMDDLAAALGAATAYINQRKGAPSNHQEDTCRPE